MVERYLSAKDRFATRLLPLSETEVSEEQGEGDAKISLKPECLIFTPATPGSVAGGVDGGGDREGPRAPSRRDDSGA
jgi:hypothetical protein